MHCSLSSALNTSLTTITKVGNNKGNKGVILSQLAFRLFIFFFSLFIFHLYFSIFFYLVIPFPE